MKSFLAILFCFKVIYVSPATFSARSLLNFQSMISYTTNTSGWEYHNYGNWCGLGGSGTPVDDVDRCCQVHDGCYDELNNNECKDSMHLRTYYVFYEWDWIDNQIVCAEKMDNCSRQLCSCDKAGAECFGRYKYVEEHRNSVWESLPSKPSWWPDWSLPKLPTIPIPSWVTETVQNSTIWNFSWLG